MRSTHRLSSVTTRRFAAVPWQLGTRPPLSRDEAYLDVSDNLRGIPTALATAKDIRSRILADTGLTASGGISYNKLLAKLASDHRKPNGQFVITPEVGPSFVEGLPVGKFHGVGPVTADTMKALGIHTGADLRARSAAFLRQHFGKPGAWYHAIARAEDDRPVKPDRVRKSSGSETTFAEDLTNPSDIEARVRAMANDVWAWCETHQMFGQTVTVKIKYASFQVVTRSRTMRAPVDTREQLDEMSAVDIPDNDGYPLARREPLEIRQGMRRRST
jgi:DNA polymerase-4